MDTHSDTHVAVALDGAGRRLGELAVPNDRAGYTRLWDWTLGFGVSVAAGVLRHRREHGREQTSST
ncbi:MAG: hypothetical protein ACJ73Y_01505 [Rubrobacteraceae bacterium]